MFEKPCGVVVDVKELYGSESKSQVYAQLHKRFWEKKLKGIGRYKSVNWIVLENLAMVCLCTMV